MILDDFLNTKITVDNLTYFIEACSVELFFEADLEFQEYFDFEGKRLFTDEESQIFNLRRDEMFEVANDNGIDINNLVEIFS